MKKGFLIIGFLFLFLVSFVSAIDMVIIPGGGGNVNYTYAVGKYEVTQQEWFDIMGTWPSRYDGVSGGYWGNKTDREVHPVENIEWTEAADYGNKLSVKENLIPAYDLEYNIIPESNGYRLPYVVEWKKAAGWNPTLNNGTGGFHIFGFGRDIITGADANTWHSDLLGDSTTPVGWYDGINLGFYDKSYITTPNENYYSIFDMSGNVLEFITETHPVQGYKISRGGAWSVL